MSSMQAAYPGGADTYSIAQFRILVQSGMRTHRLLIRGGQRYSTLHGALCYEVSSIVEAIGSEMRTDLGAHAADERGVCLPNHRPQDACLQGGAGRRPCVCFRPAREDSSIIHYATPISHYRSYAPCHRRSGRRHLWPAWIKAKAVDAVHQ